MAGVAAKDAPEVIQIHGWLSWQWSAKRQNLGLPKEGVLRHQPRVSHEGVRAEGDGDRRRAIRVPHEHAVWKVYRDAFRNGTEADVADAADAARAGEARKE